MENPPEPTTSAQVEENRAQETPLQEETRASEEIQSPEETQPVKEMCRGGETATCSSTRSLDGRSVLSVVLGIQRRSTDQRPQSSGRHTSYDILTRVSGRQSSTSQPAQSTCERATTTSPLVSSLEVNLSDTVLARSITLENIDSRAEARIQLVDSTPLASPSPPSYATLPPEDAFFHTPPPPSYEQTFGIRYLDRDLPFIAINNAANDIWGYRSQPSYCIRCNAMVLTTIETRLCFVTHLSAIISFVSLCWPCMMLPYLLPAFKQVNHFCPACNSMLGTYRPISRRRNTITLHNAPR